jgi:hypothetical protein
MKTLLSKTQDVEHPYFVRLNAFFTGTSDIDLNMTNMSFYFCP